MLTGEMSHLKKCTGWLSYVHTRRQKECDRCEFTWTEAQMLSFPTCVLCGVTVSPIRRLCDCA